MNADKAVRHVAALVAYDGTDYFGFQYQLNHPSIQESLELALSKFCKAAGRVVASGRTDTGVHALGQVIAVKVEWRHDLQALMRAWNMYLPKSIVIRAICDVSEPFHPRFSALTRTYRYYVLNGLDATQDVLPRSPLTDRTCLYIAQPLAIDAMNLAANSLIGVHDFAAFGRPTQGESTVRELFDAVWEQHSGLIPGLSVFEYRLVVFTITGNAFLRHMVRNIVGTLLQVGLQRIDASVVREILESRQRERSAPPVPSQGLVLEKIQYPPELGVVLH